MEQDLFLRNLISKEKSLNWKTVCRRLNKKFPSHKVTAKACESRWNILNSSLSINEELVILLTLYRGKLEMAEELLMTRIDVKDYIVKIIGRLLSIVEEMKISRQLTVLERLQFFVCIDLALNSEGDCNFELMRTSGIDWLEVIQYLTKQKAKMSKESLHEFVQKIISNIEDKVNLLLGSEVNCFKDIMHERKDNPSQANSNQGLNWADPQLGMNFYLLARYPQNNPVIN